MLLADRTYDVGVITTLVTEGWAANRDTNLLENEQAFRDATAAAYLVGTTEGFEVVLGMMAMPAAVGKAAVTPAENRAAPAGKPPTDLPLAKLAHNIERSARRLCPCARGESAA